VGGGGGGGGGNEGGGAAAPSVFSQDCVAAIVAALNTHAAEWGVCESGCWALGNIAANVEGREACVNARAVPAIVAILERESTSEEACKKGCRALLNIACSESGQKACMKIPDPPAATDHSAVVAIVRVLQVFESSAGVCAQALLNIIGTGASSSARLKEIVSNSKAVKYLAVRQGSPTALEALRLLNVEESPAAASASPKVEPSEWNSSWK